MGTQMEDLSLAGRKRESAEQDGRHWRATTMKKSTVNRLWSGSLMWFAAGTIGLIGFRLDLAPLLIGMAQIMILFAILFEIRSHRPQQ